MNCEHQHYYTSVCWKNSKTVSEIHAELVVSEGNQAVTLRIIERQVAKFKLGQETIKDKPRSRRPREVSTPEMISLIEELVVKDKHITMRELANLVDMSQE